MGIIKDSLYLFSHEKLMPFFRKKTIFPYYHIVRDDQVAHIKNLYPYKNAKQFISDLDFLLAHYNPMDPELLLQNKVPENSFLLTFDDGLSEIYSVIFPILKEKGITAVFFINPDFVDNKESLYKHDISVIIEHLNQNDCPLEIYNKLSSLFSVPFSTKEKLIHQLITIKFSERAITNQALEILDIDIDTYLKEHTPYITKNQIREMIAAGFYFGGHTMSHPPLHELNLEEQKKEIITSIEWMKSNFDIPYSLFAFPFSDKTATKALLSGLFKYDPTLLLFGNAGMKKDIDNRVVQRFSLENPTRPAKRQVVTENLYSYYNKLIRKYNISRR